MSTHFTPTQARERQNELLATFGRMVDYANENNVNVILIAGDLLDTDSGNLRASEYVLSTIRANPSICFLYLVGNHDSNSLILAGDNLPKNLFTFGKKWRSYEFGNVVITGIEIGKNNNIYNSLVLDPNKINIVTLHGQEITGQKKDGEVINIDALKGKNNLSVNMVINEINKNCVEYMIKFVAENPYINSISLSFHMPYNKTAALFVKDREKIID